MKLFFAIFALFVLAGLIKSLFNLDKYIKNK